MNHVAESADAGTGSVVPAQHHTGGSGVHEVTSFDSFYAAEREPLIRAVTMVVGSPSAAADVVDEALLRAYQRWSELGRHPRPGGWVYRVAVNLGRSRFRRIQREAKYRWLSAPIGTADRTADDAFARRIEDDRLLAALLSLPTEQRAVLVARILLDYSESEVALSLHISPGTVKSRLSRGLAAMRQLLPDLGPVIEGYTPGQPLSATASASTSASTPASPARARPRVPGVDPFIHRANESKGSLS